MTGAPRSQPLEWWPESPEGWSAAWTRFASIEAPGAIVPVGRRTPPVGVSTVRADENPGPFGQNTAPSGETARPADETMVAAGGAAPRTAGAWIVRDGSRPARRVGGQRKDGRHRRGGARRRRHRWGWPGFSRRISADPASPSQADQLIPHVIYLAVWTASAVLILLGGTRLRLGALLGLGLSAVTFGLFFADAGTAIAGSGSTGGAGLVLALVGWLACAAGSVVGLHARPASSPVRGRAAGLPGLAGAAARG